MKMASPFGRVRVNRHPAVELDSVANPNDLVVVDGVYEDWLEVRRLALQHTFERDRSDYPGRRAIVQDTISGLDGLLGQLVDIGRVVHPQRHLVFSQLDDPQSFRSSQQVPHRDALVQIGGVVYLSESTAPRQGTGFFRHRRTGLTAVLGVDEDLETLARRNGYPDADSMLMEIATPTKGDSIYGPEPSDTWELIRLVELKPNRMVLFDASLFHAALHPMGPNASIRLTQNLFLRAEPARTPTCFRSLAES